MFVALVIQHAMRMQRTVLSSMTCQGLLYFFTLPHKRHDFRENVSYLITYSLNEAESFLRS